MPNSHKSRENYKVTFKQAKSYQKIKKAKKGYQKLQIRKKEEGETKWIINAIEKAELKLKKYGLDPKKLA